MTVIDQLAEFAIRDGAAQRHEQLREHFADVLRQENHLLIFDHDEIIGYLEYRWHNWHDLEVTELLCRRPRIIWALRTRLNRLPWETLTFYRRRDQTWKTHRRL